MKELQMPRSYAAISEQEQSCISGGGPLGDALDEFFGNFHLDDLFFGGGLISFSFSFVPMLLFNVVKTGIDVGIGLYHDLSHFFGFSQESEEVVQYLSSARQRDQQSQKPAV